MNTNIKRWYLIQNIIALIVIVALHLSLLQTILFGLVLLLSIIFSFDFGSPIQLKNANWFIQFFLQPWALITAWDFIYLELVQYHLNSWPLLTILFLYYLVMFIPFAFVIATKAENLFLRLVFTYSQFFIIVLVINNFKSNVILYSSVLQAVAYLILIVLLMHLWGAAGPDVKSSKKENILVIITLVAIVLIYAFLNASNNMDTVQEAIKYISRDNIINFWESIEAGIGEEIFTRYAIAICLLWIFSKSAHRLLFTILGSSIIFGFSHLANLFNGQSIGPTVAQVIYASGTGFILMVIYLYTGKIWVTMILHFIFDWSSSWVSNSLRILGSTVITNIDDNAQFIAESVVILIIFSIILIWMMHGKRRQVMEEHARALIKE